MKCEKEKIILNKLSKNNHTKNINLSIEEIVNTITHALGFLLSIVGSFVLLYYNNPDNEIWRTIGFLVYGISLMLLYLSSTLYHSSKDSKLKKIFKRFDHSAIFLLIAGTYTPIVLIMMRDTWVIYLFILVWLMAIFGITGEFLFTEKLKSIEFIMYIFMGWIALVAIKPLLTLPIESFNWIILGGVIYSIGVIFYKWENFPFNHAIWHLFVLGGSIAHFIAISHI